MDSGGRRRRRRGGAQPLTLSLGGVLAPPLDRAAGVTRAEVQRVLARLASVVPDLLRHDSGAGFLKLPRRRSVLAGIEAEARYWRRRGIDDLVHIGIGGSSLGAEALLRALSGVNDVLGLAVTRFVVNAVKAAGTSDYSK